MLGRAKHQPSRTFRRLQFRITTSSTSITAATSPSSAEAAAAPPTFQPGVGDTFPALGTLVSQFVAIPTVSLGLLKFGYRLLILALVTFLALAILALALSLRFPFPVLARQESRYCTSPDRHPLAPVQ